MGKNLHIFFFPIMAHGHTIPAMDLAKLFASRGVKATIVTTPFNASYLSKTIERAQHLGLEIDIQIIEFPSVEVGLPEGYEHADKIGMDMEMRNKFAQGLALLQDPFEKLVQEFKPDCIVSDRFFPWTTDVAAKFGIPRLVFTGSSFFHSCVTACLGENVLSLDSDDEEPFLLVGLPGDIRFTRKQIPPSHTSPEADTPFAKVLKEIFQSELKSYGMVFNSFYELESAYADHYRKSLGKKAWHVGPVCLCNKDVQDKVGRGKDASITENDCLLKWLSSKKPNSVVYVCFGSLVKITTSQLQEIAKGLDNSGKQFVWVVNEARQEDEKDWIPEGFEKRIEGKGLVIRGWVPQVLILEHEAIGGFVTHCGWNSTLEGITTGLPMVTFPVFADQFYNEKLVTQVLKIGISLGANAFGDDIKSEAIEKAVTRVMEGEEAEEMRKKAKEFGELARKAVEEGGSSYTDLSALIEEIRLLSHLKQTK